MDKKIINKTISSIITELIDDKTDFELTAQELNKYLFTIVSNSTKAIQFVSVIEDEFEIEFNDEDVNLNFFMDIENIIELVGKFLLTKKPFN